MLAAGLGLGLAFAVNPAQIYPAKPITLYVGFPSGGAADTVARVLADEMSKKQGQPVLVDNMSGASGSEVLTNRKPEDFQAHYLRELTRWATLVQAAGIVAR